MNIGILIDSAATRQQEELKNTNVNWIPLHITFGNEIDIVDTMENMKKYDVYKKLSEGQDWKTSQASPGEVEKKYDELLKKYDHIVHIPIPGNLSSMLATAVMVSNEEKYKDKVTVIQNDSLAAQGIKEAALHLNDLIEQKKLTTPQEIVDEFEKIKNKFYVAIIPGDLKKLAHGGRAVKLISTVLNIFKTKLLIKWQTKPDKEAMGRTITGLMAKVIEHVKKDFNNNEYKFILTKTPLTNEKIYSAAVEALNESKISFVEEPIPNLYPIHAGIDTIGFIVSPFVKKEK